MIDLEEFNIPIEYSGKVSYIVQSCVITEDSHKHKGTDEDDDSSDENLFYPLNIKKIFSFTDQKNKQGKISVRIKEIKDYFNGYFYFNHTKKIAINSVPFPPYRVEPNMQIFVSLASIFSTFIFDMDKITNNMKVIYWIYNFKTRYPNMPNINELIMNLDFQPEDMVKTMSISQNSFIIKKFLHCFGVEFNSKIEYLNISVPFSMTLQNIDADFIAFVPFLNSITAFEIQSGEKVSSYDKIVTVRINPPKTQKTQTPQKIDEKACTYNKYAFFAGLYMEKNKVISVIKHPNREKQVDANGKVIRDERFLKFDGENIDFIAEKKIPIQRVALFYRLVESKDGFKRVKNYSFDYQRLY